MPAGRTHERHDRPRTIAGARPQRRARDAAAGDPLRVDQALVAALDALVAAARVRRSGRPRPADRAIDDGALVASEPAATGSTINPIDRSLGGWHLAQLAIGVLGVLTITGEYRTGMIRSSLMAAPKRLPVLWAKLLVFCAVTFVLMLVAAFIAFFGGQAIFTEHHVNVAAERAARVARDLRRRAVHDVTGALCIALGTIVRRTAGGIALFVGVFFVLPGLIEITLRY